MLLSLVDLLVQDPGRAIQVLPIILIAVGGALLSALTVHEYGHALVAHRLGDETARLLGRLSLNPLRHLDPLGGLMLLIVGFGWGKPVPVGTALLQRGRAGLAAVSLAGPGFNFLLAAAVALLARVASIELTLSLRPTLEDPLSPLAWSGLLGGFVVFYNLLLGVFNLVPLAPLDGSKVVIGVAPQGLAWRLSRLESYGPIVLVLIVAADIVFKARILSSLLMPPVAWLSRVLAGAPLV